jgi:hypothetical protein
MTAPGTRSLSLDRLRREGERFMQEISREYYEAHAGLKPTAQLQQVYERHAAILGREALDLVVEEFRGARPGTEARRSARLLVDWLAESQSARELAPLDERQIEWEGSAVVRLTDGREIPYERAAIEMANAADRRERLLVEAGRSKLVERELAPLRRERFERERDITELLGLAGDYNATFELLSGVGLGELRAQCEQFLGDTEDMWNDVLPGFLRRRLGIRPDEATRSDALALFRAREFDASFPAGAMESAVSRQVREMGIDPFAGGRIRLDTGERAGKRARAFCAPVRVPDEVYLVLRPHGGQTDWNTFLHELGHALHFAYMRPDLPMEYRWLGDNSVTESFAMLFDHLMQDPRWLERYTGLAAGDVEDFVRAAVFEELHFLRRYTAKLIYETELYGGATRWETLPDLYVERLSAATTFRYDRSDAFVDVDPRYYAARYLRAWQLQALVAETLTERYDVDWWRNPRAGPWVCGTLFGEGQRELGDELAQRVARKPMSFAPLVRAVERALA